MTQETKHTQGSWRRAETGLARSKKPASRYPIVYAGNNKHVAVVSRAGLSEAEIEGNINLISAAPDLIDALEDALDMVREEIRPILRNWVDEHLPKMVERLLQEELEKARGG